MKRLTFSLPNNHTGVAEIEKDEVILYIEKPGSILWGLIDWPKRRTEKDKFMLGDRDEDRRQAKSISLGGIYKKCYYILKFRDVETFNPRAELERMFETYQAEQQRAPAWDKRVENFVNKI